MRDVGKRRALVLCAETCTKWCRMIEIASEVSRLVMSLGR